jgi:Ubiquitin-conjugating enzyme
VDLARIRREIAQAQGYFPNIESHLRNDGRPYVLALLQTSQNHVYSLSISFPDTYPNAMPVVFVRTPTLHTGGVHQYKDGNICYLHPRTWNPGLHTLTFVIERAAKWLNKYEVLLATGRWPGAEILH